jgi:aspartate carbamoyltransferase catalytic subunit
MQLSTRHLLGIKNLSKEDISLILSTAEQFKEVLQRPVKKVPSLRDVTIVNLFYENSTRTRFSFELAEKRLSADTINFAASTSSAAKGETLLDTVNNILSMKVDMVVMRHHASGAPHFLAQHIPAAIINALFPLKKKQEVLKVEKLRSLEISCTAAWHRVIFIC